MADEIPTGDLEEISAATAAALSVQTLVEGAKTGDHWRRQSRDFLDDLIDSVSESIRNGESVAVAATRIRGGTIQGERVKGIVETSQRRATTLASTAINAVSNASALETFQANSDLIKGIQQVSTLDNRTSDVCIAYSGQAWDIETLEPLPGSSLPFNGGPPRHFNCRSRIVPITVSFEELGIDADDLTPSTRASMDGQVSADITFDQFLRSKPDEFADKLLGKTRARLWREGKITLTQLVDMRGDPLSVRELLERTRRGRR